MCLMFNVKFLEDLRINYYYNLMVCGLISKLFVTHDSDICSANTMKLNTRQNRKIIFILGKRYMNFDISYTQSPATNNKYAITNTIQQLSELFWTKIQLAIGIFGEGEIYPNEINVKFIHENDFKTIK